MKSKWRRIAESVNHDELEDQLEAAQARIASLEQELDIRTRNLDKFQGKWIEAESTSEQLAASLEVSEQKRLELQQQVAVVEQERDAAQACVQREHEQNVTLQVAWEAERACREQLAGQLEQAEAALKELRDDRRTKVEPRKVKL